MPVPVAAILAYACSCWIYAAVDVVRRRGDFRDVFGIAFPGDDPNPLYLAVQALWIVTAPLNVPFFLLERLMPDREK